MVVILLQVVANVVQVVIDESGPFGESSYKWKRVVIGYQWTSVVAAEVATLAFYVFRPKMRDTQRYGALVHKVECSCGWLHVLSQKVNVCTDKGGLPLTSSMPLPACNELPMNGSLTCLKSAISNSARSNLHEKIRGLVWCRGFCVPKDLAASMIPYNSPRTAFNLELCPSIQVEKMEERAYYSPSFEPWDSPEFLIIR
ncbi:hypothetical protein HAX54_005466 [Datura stramonium]|uniref:Uncharacterized protein n=1 Tax=Datura stramonium TaxID=4076 RepID=A0ABS8TA89_DATST|nr:hypothetical protein [Datura stramonium]